MNNKITIIERKNDAEDNALNLEEREILKRYCDRHGEEINTFIIWKYDAEAITVSGRKLIARKAWTGRKCQSYIYLNEEVNGKQIRIKKSEY